MITASGKTALRRYFAGYSSVIADTICVGIGNAAGETMQCEWARFPIVNSGTNVDNSTVIFKASSNINVVGGIYEVGLLQGAGGNVNDITISRFTAVEETWAGGSFTSTNSRLDQGLKITANGTATATINPVPLSTTADKDKLVLAGYSSGAGTVSVTLEFDNGSTVTTNFPVVSGYNFVSATRSSLTKTGAVNWLAVTKAILNTTVDFTADLLKFKIENPVNEILVARTVLSTPYVTRTDLPLEIEYPLGVAIAS